MSQQHKEPDARLQVEHQQLPASTTTKKPPQTTTPSGITPPSASVFSTPPPSSKRCCETQTFWTGSCRPRRGRLSSAPPPASSLVPPRTSAACPAPWRPSARGPRPARNYRYPPSSESACVRHSAPVASDTASPAAYNEAQGEGVHANGTTTECSRKCYVCKIKYTYVRSPFLRSALPGQ